ncbi:MAG: SDR family oxidoreductase, partial [Betaproteobacteria bacterium]|nr:SDR family oxidoreductase [Betaproteobacteria bacterium]
KVLDAFGRIDGAVNSAGVEGRASDLIHSTEADWDNVIGTNLKGVWLCMKYQLPIMSAQGKGSIVNLSSVAGLEGSPGASLYSASKHGVIGLSRSAALEFARKGIRINVVCPGPVETPMIERVIQARTASRDSLIAREPMGRMAAVYPPGKRCARHSRRRESMTMVTGPSLINSTCMSAPNRPVCTWGWRLRARCTSQS